MHGMMEVVHGFRFDIWSQGMHVIVLVSVLQLVALGASTRNMMDARLTQSNSRGQLGTTVGVQGSKTIHPDSSLTSTVT